MIIRADSREFQSLTKILIGVLLLVAVLVIGAYVASGSYAQSFLSRGKNQLQAGETDVLPVVTVPNPIVVEAKVVPYREAP